MKELETQRITDYELWPGVFVPSIKKSINLAHKQIVEYAQLADWPEVVICEDDIMFSHPNSWSFFLQQKPISDYDLFLSMIYLGQPDENNIVKDFTGLTMYSVAKRYYETFLSVPDDDHLDRLLSKTNGKFVVCTPFVAMQYNGFSANTGKEENYDQLLNSRQFYLGS